jgi:hypothetical protein
MMDVLTYLWEAPHYGLAGVVLSRGLALVYLVAFINVRNQFRPLLGERGLMPVPEFLARSTFATDPSLFHWQFSDRLVTAVAWGGMLLAAGVVVGCVEAAPVWLGIVWWLAIWGLYLSVVNVGQTFYAFGWESLLLEAGFYAAFLGNAALAPPGVILLCFRWLLFRVEFGAGMIKMRGDRCWRQLTCLDYHHETQPMPSPTSRWFHHLPPALHRLEVASNHLAQLVAPFALFLPQPLAGIAALVMILSQGYLMISGNYAWLNVTTLLLGFSAIPDSWFGVLGIGQAAAAEATPRWFAVLVAIVALMVVWLSRHPVRNLLGRRQLMNFSFNRYHLVNAYGAFGSVTRRRRELILEGTREPHPREGEWWPYEFKGKPGDPRRRPPQWAPYHLRLDWLMWFVPLSPSYGQGWLEALVQRLLDADPPKLALLENDPFAGEKPLLVRGRLVDYRFSTREEKRRSGVWWVGGASTPLFGPVALNRR